MKKKPAKKPAKKKPAPKSFKSFGDWWDKVAQKKVAKIEKDWLKDNEPNDPEEDSGGDHWHVNQMMHEGAAFEMTAEIAEDIWNKGAAGEEWEMTMSDGLFCDLDEVIIEAYDAGKKSRNA